MVRNVTSSGRQFNPQVSLSENGDRLIITDPTMGVVRYKFVAAFNRWKEEGQHDGGGKWNGDEDKEYYVDSLDLDDRGDVVAYSAFEVSEDGTGVRDSVRIVDYGGGKEEEKEPAVAYARDFRGWDVDLSVSSNAVFPFSFPRSCCGFLRFLSEGFRLRPGERRRLRGVQDRRRRFRLVRNTSPS